jgi:hypothetical protein
VKDNLTFDPELLDVRLDARRLQADAAEREEDETQEEDLASVLLHEAAQVEEVPLQPPSQPQSARITQRLALQMQNNDNANLYTKSIAQEPSDTNCIIMSAGKTVLAAFINRPPS